MREKIRLSDLTVLYVCLSDYWGTTEKRCILDATYFRNIGGSPFILCYENSPIDSEAESEDLPRLFFQHPLSRFRSKLNFYFQIQHILERQQIDLIHTYNVESLVPLGIVLRRIDQIPLLLTFNEEIEIKKMNLFDRWFMRRVDSVFTFSALIREVAIQTFPIHARKIHVTGAGVDFPAKITRSLHLSDKRKVVTFISRTEDDLKHIRTLVDMIQPLMHKLKSVGYSQELIFTFLTDISWYNHPLYEGLKRMILERHLEMYFSFESRPLASSSFQDCDVFIGLPHHELFSEHDLFALITQTPVLLPRTSTRQHLVKQGKFGETYYPGDGRELKDKLIHILMNYSRYLEELTGVETELQEQHHFEKYAQELYAYYEKLYSQRIRYSQKQKRLA